MAGVHEMFNPGESDVLGDIVYQGVEKLDHLKSVATQ